MGVDVAAAAAAGGSSSCYSQWSHYSHHPPNPSSIASAFSSLSSSLKTTTTTTRGRIIDHQKTRSPLLMGTRISRSRSLDIINTRGGRRTRSYPHTITRAISANLYDNSFSSSSDHDDDEEEEIISRLQELANQQSNDSTPSYVYVPPAHLSPAPASSGPPTWPPQIHSEYWSSSHHHHHHNHSLFPESLERKANNSSDLPLSLRMIKQKKKKNSSILIDQSSLSSPVKKAFSSMVFIIEELQRYTLQMRELLCLQENLQGILARIQGEMHASFVWLFQQIFSCTPTLMLSLMLLLANFTLHSMSTHAAAAPSPLPPPPPAVTEHQQSSHDIRFDHSSIKTFSVVDGGRTASVGGGGGSNGGKARPVAGETGDGWRPSALPDGIPTTAPTEKKEKEEEEEEAMLWNRMVEEASKMQAAWRDEALMDPQTLQQFVSPVTVQAEPEDTLAYSETEAMYHRAISQDPSNPLLLCNYAQFLHLVLHDPDRAEYYFKRAVRTEPVDAESLSRYASFLWMVRNNIEAAEETYLEAIAADPSNTFHAANYAHFLWSTGGVDTCYPLD